MVLTLQILLKSYLLALKHSCNEASTLPTLASFPFYVSCSLLWHPHFINPTLEYSSLHLINSHSSAPQEATAETLVLSNQHCFILAHHHICLFVFNNDLLNVVQFYLIPIYLRVNNILLLFFDSISPVPHSMSSIA